MKDSPIVSIVAVCFNQRDYVEESLNSIVKQTYPYIQLIIADDGSTDGSKEKIRKWITAGASNAVFIDHPKNLGLTRNINSAISKIKGDYFQVFGCDDVMLEDKIKIQVELLEAEKNIGVVYTDMLLIDEAGNSLGKTYFQKHLYKKPLSGGIYLDLIERFIISAPSVLIRKEVLDYVGRYNESLDYEDHDFFLRAAKRYNFLYLPQVMVHYRRNAQSLTSTYTNLKFLKNSFLIYFQGFDKDKKYRALFLNKLLFYAKNLYKNNYKLCAIYFFKAFVKTGSVQFLKFSVASIPFCFKGNKI